MAAAQDPRFARAVQLLQSGRLADAAAAVNQILLTEPGHFDALHLSGIIAFQSGEREKAVGLLQQALDLRPEHAQILSDLGMMCHAVGRLQPAATYLDKALRLQPGMAAAHLNMGNVQQDLGRQQRAEHHLREALRLQPKLGAALNNLSRLLLTLGRAAEAAAFARQLIQLAPQSPAGHSRLGAALDRLGRFAEAVEAHKKAVALNPRDNGVRLAYANSLAGYGRLADAIAECRTAIASNPGDANAYAQLAGLTALADEPDLHRKMKSLMDDASLPDTARGILAFSLGRAEEQQKQYERAFNLFEAANSLFGAGISYDPATAAAIADDVIAAFPPEIFARLENTGSSDATPIFIIGMPRSGTTLTEQILCARPEVFGAGEPALMRSLADRASAETGAASLTGMMQAISPGQIRKLGEDYVRLLREYAPDAARIIDKVPGNFVFAGLIRLCLPNAKIIHCARNPADTCLSIFKNRFATGNQLFSYDLDHLAAYYAAYRRLMAHWDAVLPGVIHTVQYEQMVADQVGQSKALYAHCGLDWTDDAMAFFKTERPVHTASVAQVRQPIYGGSSGIAARYGEAARPLFDALERAGIDPAANG